VSGNDEDPGTSWFSNFFVQMGTILSQEIADVSSGDSHGDAAGDCGAGRQQPSTAGKTLVSQRSGPFAPQS